jgi:hypothetical protein
MALEAVVGDDGKLVVQVPDRYKGKRVHIALREIESSANAAWGELQAIFQQADRLPLSRHPHEEILSEVRELRESR